MFIGIQKDMMPVITFNRAGIRSINIIPQVCRDVAVFCSIPSLTPVLCRSLPMSFVLQESLDGIGPR